MTYSRPSQSRLERPFKMDFAPGKVLIKKLADKPAPKILEKLFNIRCKWCYGDPFVPDFIGTFGVFDDLRLDADASLVHLPHAIHLAKTVPDYQFHLALFLLTHLIPDDRDRVNLPSLAEAVPELQRRYRKLHFVENLEDCWEMFLDKQAALLSRTRVAATARKLDAAAPVLDETNEYETQNFPDLTAAGMAGCGVEEGLLTRRIQLLLPYWENVYPDVGSDELMPEWVGFYVAEKRLQRAARKLARFSNSLSLTYATRIKEARYWVWAVPDWVGATTRRHVVFLRTMASESPGLGYWSDYEYGDEATKPIDMDMVQCRLRDIELNPRKLVPVVPVMPVPIVGSL